MQAFDPDRYAAQRRAAITTGQQAALIPLQGARRRAENRMEWRTDPHLAAQHLASAAASLEAAVHDAVGWWDDARPDNAAQGEALAQLAELAGYSINRAAWGMAQLLELHGVSRLRVTRFKTQRAEANTTLIALLAPAECRAARFALVVRVARHLGEELRALCGWGFELGLGRLADDALGRVDEALTLLTSELADSAVKRPAAKLALVE